MGYGRIGGHGFRLSRTASALGRNDRNSVRLRRGLRHLSARLAHRSRRGIGQQPGIIENGAELVAIAEAANRGLGAVGVHAGEFAVLAGAGADLLDGAYDLLEIRQRLTGLHHGEQQDLLIGVLPIIGAAVEHRAIGTETARAAGWIAAYV